MKIHVSDLFACNPRFNIQLFYIGFYTSILFTFAVRYSFFQATPVIIVRVLALQIYVLQMLVFPRGLTVHRVLIVKQL